MLVKKASRSNQQLLFYARLKLVLAAKVARWVLVGLTTRYAWQTSLNDMSLCPTSVIRKNPYGIEPESNRCQKEDKFLNRNNVKLILDPKFWPNLTRWQNLLNRSENWWFPYDWGRTLLGVGIYFTYSKGVVYESQYVKTNNRKWEEIIQSIQTVC